MRNKGTSTKEHREKDNKVGQKVRDFDKRDFGRGKKRKNKVHRVYNGRESLR